MTETAQDANESEGVDQNTEEATAQTESAEPPTSPDFKAGEDLTT